MTKAEEVMEVLAGRVGTCYCGLSLMSVETTSWLRCPCGRRWEPEGPPNNSWRRYLLMTRTGRRTKYDVGTPSCRHD